MSSQRTRAIKTTVIAATAAAALTLGACSSSGVDANAADGSGAPLKIGMAQGVPADLMTYVADKEGMFTERGVNVEITPATVANTLATALISNDFNTVTMVPALQWPAIEKGACIKALNATIGNTLDVVAQPGAAIAGDPTNPNSTMASLKGKSIGVIARGSGTELWIAALLAEAGMDPAKDVTFVAVGGPATAVQAFKAKQVDALYYGPTMFEVLPPSEITRVTDIIGRDGNALSPLMQAYNTTSCATVEQRPNDVLNYCKAMWDTYDYSRDPANATTMGNRFGELLNTTPAAGLAAWEALKDTFKPMTITEASWQAQAPLVSSPAPTAPDFASSTYAPCAGGDPR